MIVFIFITNKWEAQKLIFVFNYTRTNVDYFMVSTANRQSHADSIKIISSFTDHNRNGICTVAYVQVMISEYSAPFSYKSSSYFFVIGQFVHYGQILSNHVLPY